DTPQVPDDRRHVLRVIAIANDHHAVVHHLALDAVALDEAAGLGDARDDVGIAARQGNARALDPVVHVEAAGFVSCAWSATPGLVKIGRRLASVARIIVRPLRPRLRGVLLPRTFRPLHAE